MTALFIDYDSFIHSGNFQFHKTIYAFALRIESTFADDFEHLFVKLRGGGSQCRKLYKIV